MAEKFDRSVLATNMDRAIRYQANMTEEAYEYLEQRGIPRGVAAEYRLGLCDDIHPGRLAIPYLRGDGVVWFNYRTLDPGGKPKYIASGARHLYNTAALDEADRTGEVAIAEGELDALVSSALCGLPAVGVPGATQWTGNKHWRELFVGYQVVWVLADPDEAGLGLAAAIMESLPRARLARLPGDVGETFLRHGDIRSFLR